MAYERHIILTLMGRTVEEVSEEDYRELKGAMWVLRKKKEKLTLQIPHFAVEVGQVAAGMGNGADGHIAQLAQAIG
jgi:hypothetical protein